MENEKKLEESFECFVPTRIPQDFVWEPTALERQFGKEAPIIRDLIAYCIHKKMYADTLWGDVTFTIEDFAKEFNYRRQELSTIKESKYNDTMLDGHDFHNVFELALFRALKENFIISRKYKKKDGTEEIAHNSYRILSELRCNINDSETQKKRKQIYTVKISNELLNVIIGTKKEFYLFDLNQYKQIRSRKGQDGKRTMYQVINQLLHFSQHSDKTSTPPDLTKPLDEVAKIMGIDIDNPKDKKKRVKQYLDEIKEQTGFFFDYSFVTKENERFKYYVEFSFSKRVKDWHKDSFMYSKFMSKFISNRMKDWLEFWIKEHEKDFYAEYQKYASLPKNNYTVVVKQHELEDEKQKYMDNEDFQKEFWLSIQDPDRKRNLETLFRKDYEKEFGNSWPEDKEITFNL